MGTKFEILCHVVYTKYLSRHAISNVRGMLLYAIVRPCWVRRNPFFGQDYVMPRLNPSKGGHVVLRNYVQREFRHTSMASTDSWKKANFLLEF